MARTLLDTEQSTEHDKPEEDGSNHDARPDVAPTAGKEGDMHYRRARLMEELGDLPDA